MINVEVTQTQGVYEGFSWQGLCRSVPTPGRTFGVVFGDDDERLVLHTTMVLEVCGIGPSMHFKTRNSSYVLRILTNTSSSAA